MDFHDENRYRKRRVGNKILGSLWSAVLTIIVVIVAVIVLNACLPWLKTL
jgi:hypothetical protein